MPKSDKATVLQRTQDVLRLLLAGAEFAEIRQYATEKGWHVRQRQLRRYIETAYANLAKTTDRDRQQLLGRHLMQRRALFARALKAGDLRTALQVLRDEAELQGLYPAKRNELTGRDGEPLKLEVEARMSVIELRRQLLDEPNYLDYLRERALIADTGPIRANG